MSDSTAPGIGILIRSRAAASSSAADTLPFGAEDPGQRAFPMCFVERRGTVQTGHRRRSPIIGHEGAKIGILVDGQREMRALPGAQHLRRPGRGTTRRQQGLPDTGRRRRAQQRADVARILNAVEQNGIFFAVDRNGRCGYRHDGQQAARRIDQPEIAQQGIGQDNGFTAFDISGNLAAGPRRFGDDQCFNRSAGLFAGFDQMHPVEQRAAGFPPFAAGFGQPLQTLVKRVVARLDQLHGSASCLATGPKLRRCTGEAPCVSSAAQCAAVG